LKIQTFLEKLNYKIINIVNNAEYMYGLKKQKLLTFSSEISNCNPKKILKKGYTIIRDKDRKVIRSKKEFDKEKTFSAEFHDGQTVVEKQ
ncbi:MAG: exodeoxyribonuclease VII large subunit, partial [Pseudomonadota bacterium]|nr:exodeoxyribonuclease VII large subunit [Pseudomonadota bacterium]